MCRRSLRLRALSVSDIFGLLHSMVTFPHFLYLIHNWICCNIVRMNDSAKKEFANFNFTFDDDIFLSHGDDFTEESHVSPYQPARNIFHLWFSIQKSHCTLPTTVYCKCVRHFTAGCLGKLNF